MALLYALLISICACLVVALPTQPDEEVKVEPNFSASEVSKLIATNLLKSYIDIDGNQAHSPLGVASMLAVLAEGADGDTYEEFNQVFGYPKQRTGLRSSFKQLLARYQNREYSADPSFQTWLYIYRNYSAQDAYKQVLRENYFVEVKDINRDQYDWSEPNTSLDKTVSTTTASNSKDVVGFETLKRIKIADADAASSELKDTYGEEVLDKEASKFDRVVDDKQYVEKPVIQQEIKREQEQKQEELTVQASKIEEPAEKLQAEENLEKQEVQPAADVAEKVDAVAGALNTLLHSKREDDLNIEDNETVQVEEKLHKNYEEQQQGDKITVPIQEVLDSNEPEKVTLPLEKLENAIEEASKDAGEIMVALESHISSVRRIVGARSLFRKDDIATALSANSITGRELNAKTKMLLFNGLYYRGNWARPFLARQTEDDFFYVTAEDAMKTPMLYAKGLYSTVKLDKLNAKAVYLPYENKKYAMLVIVPNELEGLHGVIEKLDASDFKYIKENAKQQQLCVCVPKFQVEETSRSESMLKNLGLRKIFSRKEADLSLLSEDKDLHVDEVVQFVNVRVDEFGSTENSLSAANLVRAADEEHEHLEINRPFLYFLTDLEEDFIIASGKIYAPEVKEDIPVTIEVELEQS